MAFIGKIFKGIGSVVSKVGSFVKKIWNNPLFQVAFNVGMMFIPGGAVLGGMSMLSKFGTMGKLLGTFGGFASKFLGPIQSMFQSGPLKMLGGFLGKAGSSSDLLSMVTSLFNARKEQPPPPASLGDARQMGLANVQQMVAYTQANQLRGLF